MNLRHIRDYIVRPALETIGFLNDADVQLVVGTGLVESGYNAINQSATKPGPGYGPWQMEEATHFDTWTNFLQYRAELRDLLLLMGGHGAALSPPVTALYGNWFYAAAMCRVRYLRAPTAHPAAGDAAGMAAYWKQWYNTPSGLGTVERALPLFQLAVDL